MCFGAIDIYAVVVPELRAIGPSPDFRFRCSKKFDFFVLLSAKEALNPWSKPNCNSHKRSKRFLEIKATASVNGKTTES